MEDLITTQWGSEARPFRAYKDEELKFLLTRTSELISEITAHTGISLFLSYGCLLGAARDGTVIPHDFDIDLGFVVASGDSSKILVAADQLIEFLIAKGFFITPQSNGHFKAAYYEEEFPIDIEFFAAWSDESRFYHYFSVRGISISSKILPLGSIELSGIPFPAPNDPEALLEEIYGKNWRIPDPSFSYNLTAEDWQPFSFLFTDTNKDFWDQYYSNQLTNKVWLESPSQFAAFIGSESKAGSSLLDIGCGNGRDSIFFATLGFQVTCADYSEKALDVCKVAADRQGLKINTAVLSVSSFAETSQFAKGNSEKFDIVYARFFLHAIDENSERNLLRMAFTVLSPNGKLVLEYRCLADDASNSDEPNFENGDHYRRLVQQQKFESAALLTGFIVDYSIKGRGYAKFRSEDPLIARTILKKVNP